MKIFILILLLFSNIPWALASDELIVRYPLPQSTTDKRYDYRVELLQLVLNETKADYGSYKIIPSQEVMKQKRAILSLTDGNEVDVIWVPTSIEREQLMLPIRIPILKGLLGYRLLIVNKKSSALISKVKTIKDLQKFTAVFGSDWADIEILRANGLKVQGSVDYEGHV